MAMMVPMRRNRNLLSELMTDPFDAFFNAASAPMQKMSPTLMRTDIKETDAGFELTIDLPGFDKEGVQAELKDGYLTVTAETKQETEDRKGTYVRQERFSGKCSRTFYVATTSRKATSRPSSITAPCRSTCRRRSPSPSLKPRAPSRSTSWFERFRPIAGVACPGIGRDYGPAPSPRTFSQLSPPYEDPVAACPRRGLQRFGCCLRPSRVP